MVDCKHKCKDTALSFCYVVDHPYTPTDSNWWSGAMQRRYPEKFKVYLEFLKQKEEAK